MGGNVGGREGCGEVIEGLLIALVGELPRAEVASDALGSVQVDHGLHGICGVGVVGSYPFRFVCAYGQQGDVRHAEALADAGEPACARGVAGVVYGRPLGGLQPKAAPQ